MVVIMATSQVENNYMYLRLLLLAGINFSVFFFCKGLVVFFLLSTGKLNVIERRTNFSGYLI